MKRRLGPLAAVAPSPDAAVNVDAVLQVKVWLVGISPMVWRRVLVPASFTLRELHGVIQLTMGLEGWEGIHLYVFRARALRYGSWELSASSPDVTLADLRFRKGAWFIYEYDLNIPREARKIYPVFTGGDGMSKPIAGRAAGTGSGAASTIEYLPGRRPESSQAGGFNGAAMTWTEAATDRRGVATATGLSIARICAGCHRRGRPPPRQHEAGLCAQGELRGAAPLRRHRRCAEPRTVRSTRASMASTPRSHPWRRPSMPEGLRTALHLRHPALRDGRQDKG